MFHVSWKELYWSACVSSLTKLSEVVEDTPKFIQTFPMTTEETQYRNNRAFLDFTLCCKDFCDLQHFALLASACLLRG